MARTVRHNASARMRPSIVALVCFAVVVALRAADAVVWRLELPDRFIVSRVLGFLLVIAYLRVIRRPIASIGLHARNLDKGLLVGVALAVVYLTLYGIQFYRLSVAATAPRLAFGAIDETGAMGGPFFTSFYLLGQIANALMEESIFRGVMLPHLMRGLTFWKANVVQALLFGLAHLVFPLESWINGQTALGATAMEAASLMIATTVGGLVFGYLYYRTANLWTAVCAHLIDSVMGLFVHIQTMSRVNAETDILMLASIGFVGLVILTWVISKRANLPTLRAWTS